MWLRQFFIRSTPTSSALSGMSAKPLFAGRRIPFSSMLHWPPSWWKEFSPSSSAKLAGIISSELAVAPVSRPPTPPSRANRVVGALPREEIGRLVAHVLRVTSDPDDADVVDQPRHLPEVDQDIRQDRVGLCSGSSPNDVDGVRGVRVDDDGDLKLMIGFGESTCASKKNRDSMTACTSAVLLVFSRPDVSACALQRLGRGSDPPAELAIEIWCRPR